MRILRNGLVWSDVSDYFHSIYWMEFGVFGR